MIIKQKIIAILSFTLFLTSCSEKILILKGHDFNSGEWLLVNKNMNKETLQIIDDENVLANNPTGISVSWSKATDIQLAMVYLNFTKTES